MKLSKSKKIILGALMATAGLGITGAAVIPTLTSAHQVSSGNESTSSGSSSSNGSTIKTTVTSSQGYSFTLMSATQDETAKTDPATAEYKITINDGTITEGEVFLIDNNGNQVKSLDFKPGDKLTVEMKLKEGYQDYTVRDFNLTGKDPSIFIPSKNDPTNKNKFIIQMPEYNDTVNQETGKSDIYYEGNAFTIRPTFIKESIGTTGNNVNWQHGAFADSLNGYVYDLSGNLTWSTLKDNLYKTFENKEINNPIDVYIYLHGYNLTLDTKEVDLGIDSGWAIHIYNNKFDNKESEIKSGMNADGYGEIKVPANQEAHVGVKGSIALGSGVKYKFIPWSDGIAFISYNDTRWIGYQSNDPVQRLGA